MVKRDCSDYLQDILTAVEEIKDFISGKTAETFAQDKKTINAVVRSLEVIGEAAKKIPLSLRKKHSVIPWKKMAGMRDKLIHEYFGVDVHMVWQAAKKEIPKIEATISKILKIYQKRLKF